MQFRVPKNTETIRWTEHVKEKMRFYCLSETMVRRVLRRPDRIEEGIALRTTAVMKRKDGRTTKNEIWVMYQKRELRKKKEESSAGAKRFKDILDKKNRIIIISAWRYPGVSPKGAPPIPKDVILEIEKLV